MCKIVEEEERNDVGPACCATNKVGTFFSGVDGGVFDGEGVGETEEGESNDQDTESGTERERTNRGEDHGRCEGGMGIVIDKNSGLLF
jgi:hypothetical protein